MQKRSFLHDKYEEWPNKKRFWYQQYLHFSCYSPPVNRQKLFHYHHYVEIGLCTEGSGTLIIQENPFNYIKGDISILYPNEEHLIVSNPNDISTWNFITVFPDRINEFFPYEFFQCLSSGNGRILSGTQYPEIQHLIRQLCHQASELPHYHEALSRALITAFFLSVSQLSPPSENLKSSSRNHIHIILPAIKHITQSYDEDINDQILSVLCHCSEPHLRRLFRFVMNTSPMNYLHNVRIEHAANMLLNTNAPITEIALSVGYNTISSFNRHFKHIQGISPSEYRKTITK